MKQEASPMVEDNNQEECITTKDEDLLEEEISSPTTSSSSSTSVVEASEQQQEKKQGSKKRKGYPKEITKILNDWFYSHVTAPYPSEEEKKELVNTTKLSLLQINNWFSNKRVRYKRKLQKEGQEVIEGIDINQAFRSIKKTNKNSEKKDANESATTSPKRKKSSSSSSSKDSKKKKVSKSNNNTTTITNTVSNNEVVPKEESSSASSSTSNNEQQQVMLTTSNKISPMNVEDAKVSSSPVQIEIPTNNQQQQEDQPKKIDFFESLQQAGVVLPTNQQAVFVPPYYMHAYVDPYTHMINPYIAYGSYPPQACFHHPPVAYATNCRKEDYWNYFELESGSIDENAYEQQCLQELVNNVQNNNLGITLETEETDGLFTSNLNIPGDDYLQFFNN
ncbi:hypothetical protein ABK040_008388 [Willaertia magna]